MKLTKNFKNQLEPFIALRTPLSDKVSTWVGFVGFVLLMSFWWMVSAFRLIPETLLPRPLDVVKAFAPLHFNDFLIQNALFSIKLNLLGYTEAVLVSVALGFPIGLSPVLRALFMRYITAFRYLPLPALTGIFISLFGIHSNMKVQFLAVGIIVYLLPTVIQRVDEVEDKYLQAIKTLGANKWQTVTKVFFPHVISKLSDDIRVLVAISWTYIVIAELMNDQGGLGSLIHLGGRQGKPEKFYAVLFVIILIGVVQDKLFGWADRLIFPHKYAVGKR